MKIMKNKLMILTIIVSLSASQHAVAGYESPMIEDRLEQLDLVEDASRTQFEEKLEHLDLVEDAARTQFEEKLEQRGYTNEAGRTEAKERHAQREGY
jgi:hypothetical protein